MPTYRNNNTVVINLPFPPGQIQPGKELQTEHVLSPAELIALKVSKTSDEPYFKLAIKEEEIVFSGAGDVKTVAGCEEAGVIRIMADVNVEIRANIGTNPYKYTLTSGKSIDIKNDRVITDLVLNPLAAGNALVILLVR